MELTAGFEPATSSLPRTRSTPELSEQRPARAVINPAELHKERETGLEPATLSLEG